MNDGITRIAVVSGKGGVGKTSITASLALLLKEQKNDLILVDADVDAPNLALLFKSAENKLKTLTVQTTEKASLIPEKCVHCKECIIDQFCNFDTLSWNETDNIPVIDSIACEGCRACKYLCPEHAFSIDPVDSGTIMHSYTDYDIQTITGETILGSQTSGKLVTELKRFATEIAKKQQIKTILIDGPPGIGCPVIATVADLDYIVIVMEPTSAALHDASRLVESVKDFDTPFGFILNKADMYPEGRQSILDFLRHHDFDLLGEILLDPDWPHAIANGEPIVAYRPHGKTKLNLMHITNQLKEMIETIY